MEENFRRFREQIDQEVEKEKRGNLFQLTQNRYRKNEIDFYDFLDQMHSYNTVLYHLSDHLKNTSVSKIEISEGHVCFTTEPDGIQMMFNGKERRGIPFEFINWGFYERPEYEVLSKLVEDGMVLLDVGANIGWYSLLWGKRYPSSTIHAFEPLPEIYTYLSKNLVLNKIKNVHTYAFGLSDEGGEFSFYFSPQITGITSTENILNYSSMKKVPCRVETLDSIRKDLGKEPIDLIKCDVEGAEYNVLKGGIQTIEEEKPMLILELFNEWSKSFGYHPDEPIGVLKELGYRVFLPKDGFLEEVSGYIPSNYDRQNYFFLHAYKHQEQIRKTLL